VSEYAAPARAADLRGLPPAYVSVYEFDPARDEGIDYAQRLVQAGVGAELHHYPGTFHGCASLPGTEVSSRMREGRAYALRRALFPVPSAAYDGRSPVGRGAPTPAPVHRISSLFDLDRDAGPAQCAT
ncbi:alpha/beta hydrolase fold domain-containing protein, partial [Streptomyces sp. NPDC054956]